MACTPAPFSHQWADPSSPVSQLNGGATAWASRFSGSLSVSTFAIAAGNFSAWAHIGQDIDVLPAATRIKISVTPTVEYWVKAESWFGSYYSAEALAHLILWDSTGVEVVHEVRSLFRAIAPFWWYVESGIVRVPVALVRTITRPAASGIQRWHAAFGLQSFSGGGGFGGCHANASSTLSVICVSQFDAGGNQIR